MLPPERGPVGAAFAAAWTFFFICLLLFGGVWVLGQIWGWLLLIAGLVGAVWLLLWWIRFRRDRW